MNASPPKSRRVLIVDDHPILREGLALMLESLGCFEVAGHAEDGVEAVRLWAELRPDIALIDLQMPRLSGIDAIAAIRSEFPAARLLVLTSYGGDALVLRALRAGASGFLLKSSIRAELLEAIQAVCAGRRYLSQPVAAEIASHVADESLTQRETEILQLVAKGAANKEIALEIGVVEATVKTHLKSVFAKLQVNDRTHAVVMAAKRGIINI